MGGQRYTVSSTDTLSAIGAKFGVDWMVIANANGITGPSYTVRPGQTITIPASSGGASGLRTHTVSATDILSDIALAYGISWLRIAEANGIAGPNYVVRPGQVLTIPNP